VAALLALYGVVVALAVQFGFSTSILLYTLKRGRLAAYFLSAGIAATFSGLLTLVALFALKPPHVFTAEASLGAEASLTAAAYLTFGLFFWASLRLLGLKARS